MVDDDDWHSDDDNDGDTDDTENYDSDDRMVTSHCLWHVKCNHQANEELFADMISDYDSNVDYNHDNNIDNDDTDTCDCDDRTVALHCLWHVSATTKTLWRSC